MPPADPTPALPPDDPPRTVSPERVICKAREFVGTPHVHLGRKKGVGIDCVGMVVGTATELGITNHDLAAYSRMPDGKTLIRELSKVLVAKNRAPLPGDIVVFWLVRASLPTHCGIIGTHPQGLSLIHSTTDSHYCVEHILDEFWSQRIAKVFSFAPVDEYRRING